MSKYHVAAIEDEIEITDEMIEAGCMELPPHDCTRADERDTVCAVFQAMWEASGWVYADLMMEQ